jgi:indole-3-glycerol phosphate synthase
MIVASILDEIIAEKKKEVAERKGLYPPALLERSLYFGTKPVSLSAYLRRADLNGIIAEFKRKSPSKGELNPYADVAKTTLGYMQAGASALSVLTDTKYFGGKSSDLETARKVNYCPILRKDFVIDEYQIIEAKSIGADAVLLIASVLNADEIKVFGSLAASLGMEVLFEMHDLEELSKYQPEFIAGVNNRNLNDFSVSLERSEKFSELLPSSSIKVAESGISSAEDVIRLKKSGYDGFLVGEQFMKQFEPGKACAKFISEINGLKQ